MTQITGIGFSNFRVFSKPTFFDLAPLTIFTGTNSSGKSSVFKAIKLLNNNASDPRSLSFSGEGHKLGTFNLAKSRNSDSSTVSFELEFGKKYRTITDYVSSRENNGESGYLDKFSVTVNSPVKENNEQDQLFLQISNVEDEPYMAVYINLYYVFKNILSDKKNSDYIEYKKNSVADAIKERLLTKWNGNVVSFDKLDEITTFISNEVADFIRETFTQIPIEKLLKKFTIAYFESVKFNGTIDIGKLPYDYLKEVIEFPHLNRSIRFNPTDFQQFDQRDQDVFINSLSIGHFINKDFKDLVNIYIKEKLNDIITSHQMTLLQVYYLDSIRANAQRLYSNQSQGTAFNELLTGLGSFWSRTTKRNHYLLKFADKWLQKFGIGDKLIIKRIKGIATEVIIERDGVEVDLIDLGYGVTQFLPILLTICAKLKEKEELQTRSVLHLLKEDELSEDNKAKLKEDKERRKKLNLPRIEGPLLLIEEPESNLHPKLQSLLADFLIDVVQTFEVTLLIETHSEYLIRRLQVLTASDEVKPEHSVIYYLDGNLSSDSDNFVRKIKINPDGSLTNDFGPGFIDEATNWKMELMRLKNAQLQNLN